MDNIHYSHKHINVEGTQKTKNHNPPASSALDSPNVEIRVFTSSVLKERGKDRILKEADEENLLEVLDLGQGGDMVRDDRFACNREQGLGNVEREGAEARPARGTADEDDGLWIHG